MSQLKLQEALLPEVVSQVEFLEGSASSSNGNGSRPQVGGGSGKKGKGKGAKGSGSANGVKAGPPLKTWAANPKLFPCDVSPEAQKLIKEVQPFSCFTSTDKYVQASMLAYCLSHSVYWYSTAGVWSLA